ncbi:MAG: formate dehydrogenase subunit alpha [Planctomycetes bacterium RBG_13_60_9]|nr:MAG: formate dehydrogenase subunit alpha [Planctomycetes bacterium RBG_13_60_9]
MKKVLTTCPYCGTGCMYFLVVGDDGRLMGVEPSSEHVVAQGRLCIKGWNAHHFVNHADRLTRPLIRKNGVLDPASWDEALDLVVSRLRAIQVAHGPDSIAFFSSAKTTNEENYLMMKLARAVFKTNNVDHCARLCHSSTVLGLAATFGSGAMTNSISCMEQADCIFVIGSNTTEQHPLIGTRILKSKSVRGAKLIVADNRRIRLARLADLHVRHKNGTDVALLNGLMHVIIAEGLEDNEFVQTRTENYEQLKKLVADYTPEKVAQICGITPEEIVQTARMFASADKAMIVYSMGITQHTHGVDNVKTCANLAMLTGNIGRPGTGVNPLRGQNNVQGACDMGALPNVFSGYQAVVDAAIRAKFEKAWGVENLPDKVGLTVTTAIDAAAEGRLKALYIMGENPMMSDPDQNHVRKALEQLDFLIVQDIFPTPTTEFADVVLPATSYAEKDGTFTSTERRVQRVRKAVEPVGESRSDWEILCDVARRAGYSRMQYASASEILDEVATVTPIYGGVSFDRIDQVGLQWPCPDKQHPGTPILHTAKFSRGLGAFSPAEYRPSTELPDEEYPFVLSTGRCYFHFHTGTMTRRSQLLHREERFPYVEISLRDARHLKIRDRTWIYVTTRRGEVKAMARVTDVAHDGVLFMPFHFEEGPANLLTINALDPVAKIPEYKVCAAKIRSA